MIHYPEVRAFQRFHHLDSTGRYVLAEWYDDECNFAGYSFHVMDSYDSQYDFGSEEECNIRRELHRSLYSWIDENDFVEVLTEFLAERGGNKLENLMRRHCTDVTHYH